MRLPRVPAKKYQDKRTKRRREEAKLMAAEREAGGGPSGRTLARSQALAVN